ncbi:MULTISPECIES: hypothetical protein [Acidithrix]|uniref:Uncharacterized protein n=1 Tax=Acidithrix ferrooxidans TaxID=1280514 RepID=A0A0D8HFW3_9ACTN|nr:MULTISPECIES: hypothetical protein [Acidithrix]KJF15936.1 hypothetical protein AXFE_32210 [Acidithrix ferrooxidans]CAG4930630.1 unnamed protein product [Acidithrix sp. C25]
MKSPASKVVKKGLGATLARVINRLLKGRLARYSPLVRYFVIGAWVYNRLKKRGRGGNARIVLKDGENLKITSYKVK